VTSLTDQESYGFLVHEIRNLVNTALVAFEVLNDGGPPRGEAGQVLGRSLSGLGNLINGSVAEIRLRQGRQNRVPIVVADLVAELAPAAAFEAAARGLRFSMDHGGGGAAVHADRQVLAAVIVNLLQNALKYTRPGTAVRLGVRSTADRVLIQIADLCGGLEDGGNQILSQTSGQRNRERTGLGLGLVFSRRSVEANDGQLSVQDLPGHGCIFTVDLPRIAVPALATA
jgi:signal transduction histidine kinase